MSPLLEQLEEIKFLLNELHRGSFGRAEEDENIQKAVDQDIHAAKERGATSKEFADHALHLATLSAARPPHVSSDHIKARAIRAAAFGHAIESAKGKWKRTGVRYTGGRARRGDRGDQGGPGPHIPFIMRKKHPRGIEALESTSLAEQLEYILERARWKKEFEKSGRDIPQAQTPEIEFTSTKRQRRKGEVTTRGARWDARGRQGDADDQKSFGRKHPQTGEIAKEAPDVQQTGSPSAKAEPRERRAQIKRIKRDNPFSWMTATADWNERLNKAGRRARSREIDPGRDFSREK